MMKMINIRKTKFAVWIILLGLMLAPVLPGYALTTPTSQRFQPTLQTGNEEKLTLETLGFSDKTLRGERQTARFPLNLPAEWMLISGVEIDLQFSTMLSTGADRLSGAAGQASEAVLLISFNDFLLEQVTLAESGDHQLSLAVPLSALQPTRQDGRHQLEIRLLNESYCQTGTEARVVIKESSQLTLPHSLVAPETSLANLPKPIYQPSYLPNQAILVVPDNPSSDELAAALTVSAAFGHFSAGELLLSLVGEAALTADLRQENHLIFVGKADSFSADAGLAEIDFPAPWRAGSWQVEALTGDDGLVQMAVSPWQETKAVLLVSGETNTAVRQAAQAVGTGAVSAGSDPALAVVASSPEPFAEMIAMPPLDQTLADSGIPVQTFEGESNDGQLLTFFVPANHITNSEAFFELFYIHSALINYDRSGLIVTLNDELIGSVRLSEASTNLSSTRIILPATAVRAGKNVLAFQSELEAISDCSRFEDSGVWLTIRPESSLHLPLVSGGPQAVGALKLSRYPYPFAAIRPFAETTIILPEDDATAQQVATALTFAMGQDVSLPVIPPNVQFANSIDPALIDNQDLIIIGQPEALPIIDELGNALPVPFLPQSNTLNEANLSVSSLNPDVENAAFLELLPVPWQNGRSILAVLGNSDEAVTRAGAALTTPDVRSQLEGNFVLWNENQLLVETITPNLTTVSAAGTGSSNLPPATTLTSYEQPTWILPLLSASIFLMLLIVGYLIFSVRRRRAEAS